jgi:hypothetical protein
MTAPTEYPKFTQPPKRLVTDPVCTKCGALPPVWHVVQVLGEAPGCVQTEHVDPSTGLVKRHTVAHPRDRGGVQYRCSRCGREEAYRMPLEAAVVPEAPWAPSV